MKNFKILSLFIVAVGIASCDSDDDLPELPQITPIVINADSQFSVDDEEYDVIGGVLTNSRTQEDEIVVQLIFLGNGLAYTNAGIVGRGPLAQLIIYQDISLGNIEGSYEISDSQELGTASLAYAEDFDINNNQSSDGTVVTGTIIIEQTGNNEYIINIEDAMTDGEDEDDEADDQEFDLFFDGEVYVLN